MYYSEPNEQTGASRLAYLGQTEDCEVHAQKAEIFTRLSQKKDKSKATRASAASQAAQYTADYNNCLARQAGGLPGTPGSSAGPAIRVPSLGPAPTGPAPMSQQFQAGNGASAPRAAVPFWKNKTVIIGALVVAGVAAYFWYRSRNKGK